MNNRPTVIIIVIITILVLCLVSICLFTILGGAIVGYLGIKSENQPTTSTLVPTATNWNTSSPQDLGDDLTEIEIEQAIDTLSVLNQVVVPINDPVDLAERLGNKLDVPSTLIDENVPYEVGEQKSFWVSNTDTNANFQVDAVLRYKGENIYFWIEDGVTYNEDDLRNLAKTFDEQIIPTNREFFGSEWNPGVDGDPRFYVLYAGGLGSNIAGYFSSADEVHPEAHPYSNAHEMFLMNSDTVELYQEYIFGTMAHEFQHMIHWYQDKNEETWVNEGFSMLAEHINEYDAGGFDYEYMANPDLQLTDWGADTGTNGPHYGASYLFMVYFLDRFGEEATKSLVAHKENGFSGIDKVMQELNIINNTTGEVYTANELFRDWSVTNFVQDSSIENGRYSYKSYSPYQMNTLQTVSSCPSNVVRDVFQFGVNYIEIDCPGQHTLSFSGAKSVKLLPFEAPSSGDYFFWSNLGDESNPRLTQTFDLTKASKPVKLEFKTWYELEEDYDYVFLSASSDGEKWTILNSINCTTENPSGNSYGCGWNGSSDGWIDESIDLSAYAGSIVTIRFDYVTDAAVNGKGIAIDDFRIDAIGYASDLETDAGGWVEEGFVRLQNTLAQNFLISKISIGENTSVEHITLNPDNTAEFGIEINTVTEKVILVISGSTPITREKAVYQIDIK